MGNGKVLFPGGALLKDSCDFCHELVIRNGKARVTVRHHPIKAPNSALHTSHTHHSPFQNTSSFSFAPMHKGTGTILVTAAVQQNLLQPGEVMPTYLSCTQM